MRRNGQVRLQVQLQVRQYGSVRADIDTRGCVLPAERPTGLAVGGMDRLPSQLSGRPAFLRTCETVIKAFAYTFGHYADMADGRMDRLGATSYAMYVMEGAHPYLRDLPNAEMHILDTGHFAVEDKLDEMAPLIGNFLDRRVAKS